MESFDNDNSSSSSFGNENTSSNNSNQANHVSQDDSLGKGRFKQDNEIYIGVTSPNSYDDSQSTYTNFSSDKGKGSSESFTTKQDKTGNDVMESVKTFKSPYIALLLSYLFTGLGQIYNRKYFQGIALFLTVWGLIVFSLNINVFTLNLVPDFILGIFPFVTKFLLVPLSIYYVWKTPKLTSVFDKKMFTVLLLFSYVIKLQTLLNPIAYTIWFLSIIGAFVNSPHKFETFNNDSKIERKE